MSYIENARTLRPIVEQAMQSMDGNDAVKAVCLYPEWATDTAYAVGFKVQYDGRLWRCLTSHTSNATWHPSTDTASLWEIINETHNGTLDDPIPYDGSMTLEQGKYYLQNYEIYLCIRDTVNPVYNALAELVGVYVEKV